MSTQPTAQPDDQLTPDEQLTYEQARDQLVQVVQKLESGGAPLDESLALWERGEKLATVCQEWLDGAKAKIDSARAADSSDSPDPED